MQSAAAVLSVSVAGVSFAAAVWVSPFAAASSLCGSTWQVGVSAFAAAVGVCISCR